jgi:glucose/arabinose dehydrogenase
VRPTSPLRPAALRPALLATLVAALAAATASAQQWPTDFVTQDLGTGFDRPTCAAFVPPESNVDLFVTEKAGRVFDVRNGVRRATPVIDLRDEILDNGDRGLLSVLPDPSFASDGWIYLLYVVDPNGDGIDGEQESFGRLVRYTITTTVNGDLVADPQSRLVLLGQTWTEGIPSLHWSHSTGDMRFGSDGSLFLTTGDGAHYDATDIGGLDPNGFGPGKLDASEDVGAFRSQLLTSLAGKILRIDPATGLGLPDNPMYTGNPADHQSRIWAMGLRNPFRFTVRPSTGSPGRLYVGDVGWNDFEELDHSAVGAENFGWPCYEGPLVQQSYDAADPMNACSNPTVFDKPLWSWPHTAWHGYTGFTGQCITGMQVYGGADYPQQYTGRLFFCEYASNWIRTVRFVNGKPTEVELFGNGVGNPIHLTADPVNGDLIYIAYAENAVRRIRYTNANKPPVVVGKATPRWGPSPLAVSFDGSGSSDPEGQPLTYLWEFGDGTTDTNATVLHTYPTGINYNAKLTVTDVGGETGTYTTLISVDNTPPTITAINSPASGSFFTGGQLLTFDATATDTEDALANLPLTYEWTIDMVHDHHVHPAWAKLSGTPAQWTASSHGDGTYLHVTLRVTDSRGLVASKALDLYDLDTHAEPHLASISDLSPRVGTPVDAVGHLHYAGKGAADLLFDWGDGTVDAYLPTHLQDCTPSHLYAGPGLYTFRLTADDGVEPETFSTTILVRPLHPGVALFTPLVSEHAMTATEQWTVATDVANTLMSAGYEAEVFGAADQTALESWIAGYMNDGLRDYVVCLDSAPAAFYAGQDDGSLAEQWLDAGNGILWTGFDPFGHYVHPDGKDEDVGAGPFAADEVLDAAVPQLCAGSGWQQLEPAAADLPALAPFGATRALRTGSLSPNWSVQELYASDKTVPPESDALVIRDVNGGEYAQFFCENNPLFTRSAVIGDFFLTHLFAGLPSGPPAPKRTTPAKGDVDVVYTALPFSWQATKGATSWLFELSKDVNFDPPLVTRVLTQPSTVVDGVLRPDRVYFWRVTARNDYGWRRSALLDFRTAKLRGKH